MNTSTNNTALTDAVSSASAAASNVAHTAPALACSHLTMSWDGQAVVQDISLEVGVGEICCLVGRSGCGKTTLFHALAGLAVPDAGRVWVHGNETTGIPGKLSYMLQKDLLLPNRSILDNVCLPLVLAGVSKHEAYKQAAPLFERFGLEGTEHSWPAQLSGGMRQRAAFLRTYLMDNDVILLDEPFSALDALTREDIQSWFVRLVHDLGLSALVITHDIDEAVVLSSRIFVMCGAPQQGRASRLIGTVEVKRPQACESLAAFSLTREFMEAKRAVHALLHKTGLPAETNSFALTAESSQ